MVIKYCANYLKFLASESSEICIMQGQHLPIGISTALPMKYVMKKLASYLRYLASYI